MGMNPFQYEKMVVYNKLFKVKNGLNLSFFGRLLCTSTLYDVKLSIFYGLFLTSKCISILNIDLESLDFNCIAYIYQISLKSNDCK